MPSQQRCGMCRQGGHNIQTCPRRQQRRRAILAEYGEALNDLREEKNSLQAEISRLSSTHEQNTDLIKTLEAKLKIVGVQEAATTKALVKGEEKKQDPFFKALPQQWDLSVVA
jgi:chromosome segregation ATPase